MKLLKFVTIACSCMLLVSCNTTDSPDYPEAPFPCKDGISDALYPCEKVDMFAHLTIDELTLGNGEGVFLNDIWGWTDPQTKKEYALVGLTNGVSFVDISDPENPIVVGILPEFLTPATNILRKRHDDVGKGESAWRDIKVYRNHAYIVNDLPPQGQFHGMQVIDLTKLRNYESTPIQFEQDARYTEFNRAHNIAINEKSGFAYAVGTETYGGGLHIIDIRNPLSPEFAGFHSDSTVGRDNTGYVHDTQCVEYAGPDLDHTGEEICFNSSETAMVIADVSNKQEPSTLSVNTYEGNAYAHQGWLTEDQSYFLMNDEVDELTDHHNTKTYIWNVQDLENPEMIGYFLHTTTSIDHNLYIKQNFAFESNYNAGLQILDISNIDEAELRRVAYFDTQPDSDQATFQGTWSNYPFFKSGLVAVSDIEDGLFILRPRLR